MRSAATSFAALSCAAILAAGAPRADAAEMAPGNIQAVKVEGTAYQSFAGSGERQRLEQGNFLGQGATVETAANGNVILLFENGSTMNVRPGSKFSVDEFLVDPFDQSNVDYQTIKAEPSKSVTKVSVNEGTVLADVRKLDRRSTYEISTPLGTAGIRGTTVGTRVRRKFSTFWVTQGMIQVRRGGSTYWVTGTSPTVDANQSGDTRTATDGGPEQEVVTISEDENYKKPGDFDELGQLTSDFQQTSRQSISGNPFATSGGKGSAPTEAPAEDGGYTGAGGGPVGGGVAFPAGFGGGSGGGNPGNLYEE